MESSIQTLIGAVYTATPEQQKQIRSILHGKPKRRRLGSTKEACAILGGCHPETLRRHEKRGHLHAIRHSLRKIRWDLDEVEAFANYGMNMEAGAN